MKIRLWTTAFFCFLLWGGSLGAQQDIRLDGGGDGSSVAGSLNVEVLRDGKSVRISWDPPRETGEIIVARSSGIIDSPDKCYIADSLGKFPSGVANGVNQIYDYNLKPGTYYYAVVLAHHVRRKDIRLVANRNFTTIPVVIENNPQPSNPPPVQNPPTNQNPPVNNQIPPAEEQKYLSDNARVTDIAVKREGKFVRVTWEPYPKGIPGETIYTIYKSAEPLSSLSLMRKAEKLAEVSHPENNFLDQDLSKSQTLYYGVSVKQGLKEVLPLVQNQSFIRHFYVYDQDKRKPPKEDDSVVTNPDFSFDEMHVRDLNATSVEGGFRLDWKPPTKADENTVYSIYQALKPLSGGVSTFLGGNVKKLGEIAHPDTNVMIRMKPSEGTVYFGVTVKRGDVEDFTLTLDQSFVAIGINPGPDQNNQQDTAEPEPTKEDSKPKEEEPKTVQNEEKAPVLVQKDEGSEEEMDRILKSTFWKDDYAEAIRQLGPYSGSGDNSLRGKAKFYLGMSYYRKGEYNKALKYFVQKDTKAYNPERTEFWTKQCLSRIGGGRR
ncbi:hypothetical protein EHQ53_07865 [Leptospira langatensis]|uniref:Tetratricopeptide repeat protein n=1 Tax=Leptospira langatensis TaxID=2484983 RepID=A0A5F1ZX03_9LEPT|nr:tetratricopeptide repeat protein [Leptospira langatensis]TGK01445.1 hypothetical protein EHO57_11005 [Leptospira langatensis]TGL42105.1 hypothetical protein EHQ53_07865 [Leptospira langatensis]